MATTSKKDFKARLIEHGEKGVFGIAALMALGALATTDWRPYAGTPQEITAKVTQGKENVDKAQWPEEAREKHTLKADEKPKQVVFASLRAEEDTRDLAFNLPFVVPFGKGKEPLREPDLLPLRKLIASGGRRLIAQPLIAEEVSVDAEEDKPSMKGGKGIKGKGKSKEQADEESETEEEATGGGRFRSRSGAAGGAGEGGGLGSGIGLGGSGAPAGYAGGVPEGSNGAPAGYSGGAPAGYTGNTGSDSYGMEGMGSMGGMGGGVAAAPTTSGLGYPFVSVRAVFPVKDQITRFAQAIHKSYYDAARQFMIIDFVVERQERQTTGDPWAGAWTKVDVATATDVLDQASGIDPEVVSSAVTDTAITMPLPSLVYEQWGDDATHPDLKNFQLSDAEIMESVEYNRRLVEAYQKAEKAKPKSAGTKRGWAAMGIQDSRQMQMEVMGGESQYDSSVMGGGGYPGGGGGGYPGGGGAMSMNMGKPGGMPGKAAKRGKAEDALSKLLKIDDTNEQDKILKEFIAKQASVEGNLILFRYLDFSVEPGKSYRYRAKLVLNNPNFGRRPSEADGVAHVVEGEERETEWSNITEPVFVEQEVAYFVAEVDDRPAAPLAKLNIFQWDPKIGTTIQAILEVKLGQLIAGKQKGVEVPNPLKNTFEAEEYPFASGDVAVDGLGDIYIDQKFHPDILAPGSKSTGQMKVYTNVLVDVASTDELTLLDPLDQSKELKAATSAVKEQNKYLEYLKKAEVEAVAGGESGDYAGMSGMMSGMMGGMMGGQSNPLDTRKGKGKGKGKSGQGAGGGGYPGAGGGGYPGAGGRPGGK